MLKRIADQTRGQCYFNQMVTVNISVTVTDNVDPNPTVELVGVTSGQPDDAQGDRTTQVLVPRSQGAAR